MFNIGEGEYDFLSDYVVSCARALLTGFTLYGPKLFSDLKSRVFFNLFLWGGAR